MRKFDIVWFPAEFAQEAVRSLALLSPDELEARGKKHHFRMWENVPQPPLTETPAGPTQCHCIAVDRLGSAQLSPGATIGGKIVLLDWCEPLVNVENRYIGAYIKPETWQRPEFQRAAKTAADYDYKQAERVHALKAAKTERREMEASTAVRRYLVAVAHMTITGNPRIAGELSNEALMDVAMLAELNGVKLPALETWIAEFNIEPETAEESEYDPASFLEHVQAVMSAVQRTRHEVPIVNGKPDESRKRRTA